MYCRKCGQIIKDGEKFCRSCGTSVDVAAKKAFDFASAFKATSSFRPGGDLIDPGSDGEAKKKIIIFERQFCPRKCIETECIVLPSPPSIHERPKIDYLSTFLPAAITISIGIVMYFVMKNVMSLVYTLPMSLSGVIISVFNYRKQIREYNKACSEATESFRSKICNAEKSLSSFNSRQRSVMESNNPDTVNLVNAAETRSNILWNRKSTDDAFLTLRLGTGQTPTKALIKLDIPSSSAETDCAEECRNLKKTYSFVENAPICYDIKNSYITGIVGTPIDTTRLIRNILIQLATNHCYTDLNIVYLDSNPDMAWVSKLPHVNGMYASNRKDADTVLDSLVSMLKEREKALSARGAYDQNISFLPHILVVISDPYLLSRNYDQRNYIFENQRLGAGVIMAVQQMKQLPSNTKTVIQLDETLGELYPQENSSQITRFVVEKVDNSYGKRFADALAIVRVREEVKVDPVEDAEKAIPTKYTFYDMLGIKTARDLNLKQRWQKSDTCREIKAPLGIGKDGIIELNIKDNDSADGPHGLVAGKIGSGKTEAIVSYLLALTTLYSPYDLNFVIIDFKGGAMCNKFKGLPHLIGSITNLNDKEIERSIKTLAAEIEYRQQLLDDASKMVISNDINHVDKYTKLFKAGKVKVPMPHLVVVVDEFAQLKAKYPSYLDKLVDIAQIGRSLGMHLILATQKPAGLVSPQIWSNSEFRICLQVRDAQDSKEVIKTDVASKIKNAGRAYLMVGEDKRFELFQSGYSDTMEQITPNKDRIETLTQFNAVLNHVKEFCQGENIPQIPVLFKEPLPEQIVFHPKQMKGDFTGTVELGIYDDPEKKTQRVYTLPLVSNHLMIVGSSQMGKSNLLQTIIRGLAEQYSPEEVAIYILDFASQQLRRYTELNHVGGVVTPQDDEKLKHLMYLLDSEITKRNDEFNTVGVTSLDEYRGKGLKEIPHIVLLIDNYSALKQLYFQDDTELIRLLRDGLNAGITVVATNSNTKNGIGYKDLQYFGARIALHNNDSSEYGTLFEHCRETVEKIPGRSLIKQNDRLLDCQIYRAFEGDLNSKMASLSAKTKEKYGLQRAAAIPELPADLTTADLVNSCAKFYQSPYSIAMGLDYDTINPVMRNIGRVGCLSLSGGSSEVQSVYLMNLIRQISSAYPRQSKVWIVDNVDKMLLPLKELPNVVKYSLDASVAPEWIEELSQKAKSRMAMLESGNLDNIVDAELLVLVINNPIVATIMNANRTALLSYSGLISQYKSMGICVLVSDTPNAAFSSSEFYKKSVENKQFLWFDKLSALKIVSVPYNEIKKFSKKMEAGDGYLFNDTDFVKLKFPLE